MSLEWDYTKLAESYLRRPNYSQMAFDSFISITKAKPNMKCCDIGAGVAHLTLMLAEFGLGITAIEPNDAMRKNGIERTQGFKNIKWLEGTGESTNQPTNEFDIVTFGSSFNVCDRYLTLNEVARILKERGWFICLWNHRDLNDPIQREIENIIRSSLPEYKYGARREDQTEIINGSGLFSNITEFSGTISHTQTIVECVDAWRSHATLMRQSGPQFPSIIKNINSFLITLKKPEINIPYRTLGWAAQKI
jgi:ubiquinone/menaquinone biosynthesis C-methylase UbiE